MHPKPKRYKNTKNLEKIRALPCIICDEPPPSDPDHFKTRGSGGGDNLGNLNPMCRHHHILKGTMGVKEFYRQYHIVIAQKRELYNLPPLQINFIAD